MKPASIAPLFILVTLLVTGCGALPGSDEYHEQERDRVDQQARANLTAALSRVDRCAPTKQQVKDVLDPLAQLQGTGADSPTVDAEVRAVMAPAAKSIARAVARGENVGYTGPEAAQLARDFGVDDRKSGWMDDPDCESGWLLAVTIVSTAGTAAKVEMTARVPLTVDATGNVTGSAPSEVKTEASAPPNCSLRYEPGTSTLNVAGRLSGGTFALRVRYAAYSLVGRMRCEINGQVIEVSPPIPIAGSGDIPVTVLAKGGEGASDPTGIMQVIVLTRR